MRTSQSPPAIIHNVTSGLVLLRSCTVNLNDVSVPLLLDMGASVSLLNASTYSLFRLAKPSTALCVYDDSKIELLGSLKLTVRYGAKTLLSFIFQVAHKGANLMGLDLFTALGFALMDMEGAAILAVTAIWSGLPHLIYEPASH